MSDVLESLKRWWPLVAILALAFNLRPVAVAIGPVLAEISADIGLDGVTAGLLTSLPTLCFAAFGAVAGSDATRLENKPFAHTPKARKVVPIHEEAHEGAGHE